MFAKNLQEPGQQRSAGPKQGETDDVERVRGVAKIVRHILMNEPQGDHAHRAIHKKYLSPQQPVNDQAADGWSEQRPDLCRNDDEIHRLQQLRLRECADNGEASNWHHHRRTDTLQRARGHHLRHARGEAATDRGNSKNQNC